MAAFTLMMFSLKAVKIATANPVDMLQMERIP